MDEESLQESREDLEAEVKLLRLQNQFLSIENDNLKSNSFRMVEILSKMDTLLQKSYEKIQNLQAENHTLQEKQTANQISLLQNTHNSLLTNSSSLLSDPNSLSLSNQNALSISNQNSLSLVPNGNTLSLTNQNSLSLANHQTPSLIKNETLSDLIPIGNNGNNNALHLNGNGQEMGFLEIQSLKRLEKAKKEDEIKRDENGLFICPHCDTRMTFKHNMIAHIRVHTGERPFKCDFCPKRFSTPSSCKNHIKTHTGEKRFVCTVCDARFARSGQLRIHTKKWHDGVGYSKIESKTKTSSLEEIAETMVTSLQPSLLPTKEQIRSLGIDDNELLLRTLREGLNQSETANLTSIDTTKTSIPSTNHSEEPQVEEITIPNSFELFM